MSINAPRILLASLIVTGMISASGTAMARPEMAGQNAASRFAAMDANKDGTLSREEFFAAQPQMKEAAFDAIDKDKDGGITQAEWENFTQGHGHEGEMPSMNGNVAGADMQSGKAHKGSKAAPELIMPPAKQ